ncbi:hypothetical protein ACOSP7_019435 [Xanthoceras sorbifolium]
MSSSNSSHAPLSFDHSLLIPEEPSLDFQSLARTLNFNLPLKLDKSNYVNWKAQVISKREREGKRNRRTATSRTKKRFPGWCTFVFEIVTKSLSLLFCFLYSTPTKLYA